MVSGVYTNFDDKVLMVEGFLDKPFAPRVGTSADIVLADIVSTTPITTVTADEGTSYCLSGTTGAANEVKGSHVVYAVVRGVAIADAQAISARIDGAALPMSQAEGSKVEDNMGRVKYKESTTTAGTADVYIYLTHR
jgi:hypothetical protein